MTDAIRIVKAATHKPKPKDAELTFGTVFTDHMFVADFQEEKGWYVGSPGTELEFAL